MRLLQQSHIRSMVATGSRSELILGVGSHTKKPSGVSQRLGVILSGTAPIDEARLLTPNPERGITYSCNVSLAAGLSSHFSNQANTFATLAIIWLGRRAMLCDAPGMRTRAVGTLHSFSA